MLLAAAERGVQIRIIVYKEVEKALTCECLSVRQTNKFHPLTNDSEFHGMRPRLEFLSRTNPVKKLAYKTLT